MLCQGGHLMLLLLLLMGTSSLQTSLMLQCLCPEGACMQQLLLLQQWLPLHLLLHPLLPPL